MRLTQEQKDYIRSQYPYLAPERHRGFARWIIRIMKG